MSEPEPTAAGSIEPAPDDDARLPRGELSVDEQWQWDGDRWQPATPRPASEPPGADGTLVDGQWLWDGSNWQPAGP